MDLREEFVLRAKAPGASHAALCREFGVSRKTGYKWIARFDARGREGLADLSRRPRKSVRTGGEVVLRIAELRSKHPKWGPKKLHVLLLREFDAERVPSAKTIARVLDRLGATRLRKPRKRHALVERSVPQLGAARPNDIWTVDFKGWWRTRDGKRCEPLTVRDAFSRFVLCLKLLASMRTGAVREAFEELFQRYGLPAKVHVDNGTPFGCTRAAGGLSSLSAWWVALGIEVSFSRPAHPEDNGGHERMHADVARELEDEGADDLVRQQCACDAWVEEFNKVRPHEALAMRTPAELYTRSPKPFRGPRVARYPFGTLVRRVLPKGTVRLDSHELFVSSSLGGYDVGLERIDEQFVRVQFYELDLGQFDLAAAPGLRRGPHRTNLTPTEPTRAARSSAKGATTGRTLRPRSKGGRSVATA